MTTPATTHTPAPWNVEKPFGEPGVYISGPNTGLIAKLYPPYEKWFVGDKVVSIENNAQLIAAAPALAEALNECLKALDVAFEFEGDVFGKHHNDAVDALQNARQALQRAGLVS